MTLAIGEGTTPRRALNSTASTTGVGYFLKELDKLQDQQMLYAKKLEKEKRKKQKLDEQIEEAKNDVLSLKAATRGGAVMKEAQFAHKKALARLEKNLQMARIKLSVAHSENTDTRKQIDSLRRNKVLFLQIRRDLELELEGVKRKIQDAHKEIGVVNDNKQRVKLEKTAIKNQMMNDMEEFGRELQAAKHNISSTQEVIIGTIRDRMESSYATWGDTKGAGDGSPRFTTTQRSNNQESQFDDHEEEEGASSDIEHLLAATGASSIEELMADLQQSEEYIFSMYKNIQNSSLELERLEMENKSLENKADSQLDMLKEVEDHNEKVREDLENHIMQIQRSITDFESSYNANMQVLGTIAECLMSILRNVASDEDAVDQQLLSSGLNDRNIDTYLGVVEQRIDYLIQMSKAAFKQPFSGSDFIGIKNDKASRRHTLVTPALPSLDGPDDDDEPDDNTKVAPININLLKDVMQKRVQKGIEKLEKSGNIA